MNLKDLNLDEFICIDVETTGLDIKSDKIIEIAAVKFKSGKIVESFTKLVNPNKKIPYFITNLTGIKNSDIEGKPTFKEIGKEFVEFIGKFPIIGHNVSFDIDFINQELDNVYNVYDNEFICDTYQLSRIFLFDINSFKLQSLCSHFCIDINNAHRAEDDAITTGLSSINKGKSGVTFVSLMYSLGKRYAKLLFKNVIFCVRVKSSTFILSSISLVMSLLETISLIKIV